MPVFIKSAAVRGVTPLDNGFITEYLPSAPGEFVKVYIYGLMRSSGECEGEDCPFDADALAQAYSYWQREGLVRLHASDPLTVEYLPVNGRADKTTRKYAELVEALSKVAGTRVFSGHELSQVYDWIETFRFERETAVLCVSDCIARHGAKVRMWQMNACAKLWADNSVFTLEDARAFIEKRDERNLGAQAILKRWKRSRPATEDELDLYTKWTDTWGFDDAVIIDACAELTGAEQPSFKYLDAVLDTYRMKGALTPEAAQAIRRERDATAELARLMLERAGVKRAPSAAQKDDVSRWRNELHMDAELLLLAADACAAAPQPYSALRRLLNDWHAAGIATLPAARAELEKRSAELTRREASKRSRAYSHTQRKYTEEDLKQIGVDLLDE